jgi:catalase
MALRASPSVLFDAVVILAGPEGDKKLAADPHGVTFLRDAAQHCKAVGFSGIPSLSEEVGVEEDPGIIDISGKTGVKGFIAAARTGRFWEREAE